MSIIASVLPTTKGNPLYVPAHSVTDAPDPAGYAMGPEIDIPEVKAEVEAAFAAYERALVSNDVATLDRLFLDRPTTIRYGIAENLYGYAEIAGFRAARSPLSLARTLERTVITTFGRDFAIAATLFRRPTAAGKVGRQLQTWVRTAEGWRVAAAHVSLIDDPSRTPPRSG